jgi:DHA2 family multidrug resistance protein-like MFS transporter
MHDTTPASASLRAGRREWVGLAVLALPTLLVSIDVFVMLLALPRLSADLHASATQQLWITDVYGFLLAGFLVTMGTVGDRVGRRRLLLVGAAAFGVASVLAAYSTSPAMLIGARALLGVAGATLAPSTLALISTMFRDAQQRGLAIGIWLVCFTAGAIVGPLVGGAMLNAFWWGSAFLLGVPAMLLLLVTAPKLLPEYRSPDPGRLDPASVALSLAAVLPAVYGLKELATTGWHPVPLLAVAAGVGCGAAFVRRQRVLPTPLLDLRLFANRSFTTALASMLFGTMLTGAVMLFVTQHLQLVNDLTPLRAGVWMLPAVGANTVSFLVSPLLARRVRPAYLIGAGLAVSASGLLVITQTSPTAAPTTLIAGFALLFLGAGPLVTLSTALVIGSAPQHKAGQAAALNETAGQLGFALGIAALGSLATAVYRGHVGPALPGTLPAGLTHAATESLTSASTAADTLPAAVADTMLAPAREAFSAALHTSAALSAVLLAGLAVLITTLLRHIPPTAAPAPAADPAPSPAADAHALQTTAA